MTSREVDPWTRWYEAYLAHRAAARTARILAQERERAAKVLAGLLVLYMLVGGLAASLTVALVMRH